MDFVDEGTQVAASESNMSAQVATTMASTKGTNNQQAQPTLPTNSCGVPVSKEATKPGKQDNQPRRMGTYDEEPSQSRVNVITNEAHLYQHKKLAKDGTNKRKFNKGGRPTNKQFSASVADIEKGAFRLQMSQMNQCSRLNKLARTENALIEKNMAPPSACQ